MRSGGKGMWGRGPALYKHNYYYYYNSSRKIKTNPAVSDNERQVIKYSQLITGN
jgi:hypothetical protein